MGCYSPAASCYDLFQTAEKNYAGEAGILAELIREKQPKARRLLDVACGTGEHARHLAALGFAIHGVDLEPQFIAIAQAKCPTATFGVADMTTLTLPEQYDAVLCLFSSIGYVRTIESLHQTIVRMATHLVPDGMLVVDPWFEPGQLTDRGVQIMTHETDSVVACRVLRTLISGNVSTLEMEYVIGRPEGIERYSERHELGLFTQIEIEEAFRSAGLTVERRRGVLRKRGVYVGLKSSVRA
jgi:2-polyprenyl-3-methyl-5-hydroxy-6-metoxy-1,4-benzoquinol methylase